MNETLLEYDTFGIVTNGGTWQFYKLTIAGSVYATEAYSIGDLELLLARLRAVFQFCEQNLAELNVKLNVKLPGAIGGSRI
jgi:hypothetical protein